MLQRSTEFNGSANLSVRLCLADDLAEHGPFAPIFTDVSNPSHPVNWLVEDDDERS